MVSKPAEAVSQAGQRPLAVQFSDLRGFSAFTAEHGDPTAYRIARRFVDLVGTTVPEHGGRLLKTYGDGVMTSFDEPGGAVRCAVSMQKAVSEEYGDAADPESTISAGIGLAWGTPIRTGDDLFGHAVNVAKRLADEAKGGQIVASAGIVEQAGAVEHATYRDLGERELKGVGSHRLIEVVWRPVVSRVETADGRMDLVLTDDGKLVVELGKQVKGQVEEALDKVRRTLGAEEDGRLASFVKRQVLGRLASSLPAWVEWAESRAGLGIEHPIEDVEAKLEDGKLVLLLGPSRPRKRLELRTKEIDLVTVRALVDRLHRMQQRTASP